MAPSCSTKIHFTGDAVVVALDGELDIATAPALQIVIETLAGTVPRLIVDLSRLAFMDGFGCEVLVRCLDAVRARGIDADVRNATGTAATVLELHLAREAHDPASQRIRELEIELQGLRVALTHRATIEQAKGILMATMGCGPDEAFDVLRLQSQHQNAKLRDVAADVVRLQASRQRSR